MHTPPSKPPVPVAICPQCGRKFRGILRDWALSRHLMKDHGR